MENCPVCKSDNPQFLLKEDNVVLGKCSCCGAVWVKGKPQSAYLFDNNGDMVIGKKAVKYWEAVKFWRETAES